MQRTGMREEEEEARWEMRWEAMLWLMQLGSMPTLEEEKSEEDTVALLLPLSS